MMKGPQKTTLVNDGFALRLRQLRRQHDLTQSELGTLVGITSEHIGRYERGTANRPSADTIQRLAEVLGVSSDYLLKGTTERPADTRDLNDQELLQQFHEIERLPEDEKVVVKKFLDAFITKRKIHELTTP